MTGEALYTLLTKMNHDNVAPRTRELTLKKLAAKEGLSSDALRAKARRWGKANGKTYPKMRKEAAPGGDEAKVQQHAARAARRAERLALGEQALANVATWPELAAVFGIQTGEGAMQWWRRNHEASRATAKGEATRHPRRG